MCQQRERERQTNWKAPRFIFGKGVTDYDSSHPPGCIDHPDHLTCAQCTAKQHVWPRYVFLGCCALFALLLLSVCVFFSACCLSLLCVFFLNCYSTFAFSSSASVWDIVAPLSLRLDTLDVLATTREDLSWKRLVTFIRIFIHSIFRTVKNDQTNIYECERRLHFFTAPNTSWV